MKKLKSGSVPSILPREPLTKKAKAAVFAYANYKADKKLDGYRLNYFMVNWVLEAERMRRKDLYAWLQNRGFAWVSRFGYWQKRGS